MRRVKLPFGFRDGRLHHISRVNNGLKCGCICLTCKQPLIAKNNPKNHKVAHFSHTPKSLCQGNFETLVHRAAIQLIADEKELTTPLFKKTPTLRDDDDEIHYGTTVTFPEISVQFDNVEIESHISTAAIRPDLVGYIKSRKLLIEVKVWHAVDDDKKNKILSLNEPTIEIDLSELSEDEIFEWDKFRAIVLHDSARKEWIHHPKGMKAYKNELEKLQVIVNQQNNQIRARRGREKANELRRKTAENLKRENFEKQRNIEREQYTEDLGFLQKSLTSDWIKNRNAQLKRDGAKHFPIYGKALGFSYEDIPPFLDLGLRDDWIFERHRTIWQTAIFAKYINPNPPGHIIRSSEVTKWVIKTFKIVPFVSRLYSAKQAGKKQGAERNKWYADEGAWYFSIEENRWIPSPYVVVNKYLVALAKKGLLHTSENKFEYRVSRLAALNTHDKPNDDVSRRADEKNIENLDHQKQKYLTDRSSRIRFIIASEHRVVELSGSEGLRCSHCYFISIRTAMACEFCGKRNGFGLEIITQKHLEKAKYKYNCSPVIDASMKNLPEVGSAVIGEWLQLAGQ